jgi:hypothetical protein
MFPRRALAYGSRMEPEFEYRWTEAWAERGRETAFTTHMNERAAEGWHLVTAQAFERSTV